MDFKEIKNQKDSYSNEKKELRESMKKWLEKIVDEMGEIDLAPNHCVSVLCTNGKGENLDLVCHEIRKENGSLVFSLEYDEECDFGSLDTDDAFWLCQSVSHIVDENKKNFPHIKVGGFVHWNDPAINDFEPKDRKKQLNIVWEIQKIDSTLIEDDTVIHIAREDGGEAEVYAHELRPLKIGALDLLPNQRKAWDKLKEVWAECKTTGIDFVSSEGLVLAINGKNVAKYEWKDDFYPGENEECRYLDDLDVRDCVEIDDYSFSGEGFEDVAVLK